MTDSHKHAPPARRIRWGAAAAAGLTLVGGAAVLAQQAGWPGSARLVDDLRACRGVAAVDARAACYDSHVGTLIGAVEAGDVRLVDREEVRKTRRQLFGLALPETELLKADEKEKAEESTELFETTIASSRQTASNSWRITTAEGAVWEINNPPRKIAPAAGDKLTFKKASLGYYFIRINGQIGVKGRRVM
ncbi:MAG: hypothetical protein K2Q29_01970 [Sphingomonadales bacterium]|jgi:hypothetical protein|nr:hypothetical protein [Sphingomonadales bacterium]